MQDETKVLSSWKEIASFFGKGVRTVQRWERTLGLPIYRPEGAAQNIVFARCVDLERWLHGKPTTADENQILHERRERMLTLVRALVQNTARLHRNSEISRQTYAVMVERRQRALQKVSESADDRVPQANVNVFTPKPSRQVPPGLAS